MKLAIYQVDAFADSVFSGNPAAVCPLETWLPDPVMQSIAAENNLAETAFYAREDDAYRIRWFTPKAEVNLCGHATLASAFVMFHLGYEGDNITFQSRSGPLGVNRNNDWLTLDFPADNVASIPMTDQLRNCFSTAPLETYKGKDDLMLVFRSQEEILAIEPDFNRILEIPCRGMIVTAPGKDCDFVSRFFAPAVGINEDPVTGSAHTRLIPYWSKKLGKTELEARQLSARGGYLKCRMKGDRVEISGQGILYLTGEISF